MLEGCDVVPSTVGVWGVGDGVDVKTSGVFVGHAVNVGVGDPGLVGVVVKDTVAEAPFGLNNPGISVEVPTMGVSLD